MIRSFTVSTLICCMLIIFTSQASAQPAKIQPTEKDIPYDTQDPAQKLDIYLVKTDKPVPVMIHIHGGGWHAGSKAGVPGWLLKGVQQQKFAVVSVEYRFTQVAPHPAQMNDCLRAVQFTRLNAEKWNIDPKHIGITGGSAGGHLSLMVALHDDLAKTGSTDPVEKQSSRVNFAVSFAGPADWSLIKTIEHKHPGYYQLIGNKPNTPYDQLNEKNRIDASPISHASKDDPPVMQVHGDHDDIVPIEHAKSLHNLLKELGVSSELIEVPGANHGVAGAAGPFIQKVEAFTTEHLKD